MRIFKASTSDIPLIQSIAQKTWPETFKDILSAEQIVYMLEWMYSTDALSKSINDPSQSFWLLEDEGNYLGFAGIEHRYKGKNTTKLHKIYVLPEAQGKHIGKQLMEQVFNEARNAGSAELLLNVNRHNNATEFYKRLGFTIILEENIDIGNGYLMEDYVMSCAI